MSVDQVGNLVSVDLRERGGHLACQAMVDQESPERRAVKEDQVSLELLDHLVGMRCSNTDSQILSEDVFNKLLIQNI